MGLKLENVRKSYGEKTVVDGITLNLDKPRCIWTFRHKWSTEKLQQ